MVGEDLDHGGGAEEVVMLGIEGSHNGKQLSVIDVVVAFCRAKCLGQIGARAPLVIDVFL